MPSPPGRASAAWFPWFPGCGLDRSFRLPGTCGVPLEEALARRCEEVRPVASGFGARLELLAASCQPGLGVRAPSLRRRRERA